MKKCRKCLQLNVREFNGIARSKYCVGCLKIKQAEKKAKKKLTKGYLKREWKTLHGKAWKVWSEYVRSKDANLDGLVECYTCSVFKHWKEMHCAHYFHGKLDFDSRNLKCCCAACNTYKHGNLAVYGVKLTQELGVEGMQQLLLDSNTIRYSKDDLEEIIRKYGS